jgi:DNA invertase Pin-like site-specific DNA recombinase
VIITLLLKKYIDDGYSGLNFDRPAFKRLIADIELGKINLVITKDLSRLGRDYLQTGYYTEQYFPLHNVRYIAVNDGVDTLIDNNDIAPFKNILNDMYAKDLSRKVKSAYWAIAGSEVTFVVIDGVIKISDMWIR